MSSHLAYIAVIALLALCRVSISESTCNASPENVVDCQEEHALVLLQRSVGEHRAFHARNAPESNASNGDSTLMDVMTYCTPLKNQEAYFSAPVFMGTPAQSIDVVVDTGSGPLVIESCACKNRGYCESNSHCIQSDKSTTLVSTGDSHKLSYGSGDMVTQKVSDVVKFANLEAKMDASIMMMTEAEMDIPPPEGIMGLGLPGAKDDIVDGFLKFGQVKSFSVCFNRDKDGSLVLSQTLPQDVDMSRQLGQLGQSHWLLQLKGAAVGEKRESAVSVDICNEATSLQNSCAFIPDTGTTNILLPTEHYTKLLATMCDSWERCKPAKGDDDMKKSTAFSELLQNCGSWMGADGVDELPSVHLNLGGASYKKATVTLSPWTWIVMSEVKEVKNQVVDMPFYGKVEMPVETGKTVKACVPAFSPADFASKEAGPLWVVGLPLFYEYKVNFDLSTSPNTISFSEDPCVTCGGSHLFGESDNFQEKRVRVKGQAPRHLTKPPRSIRIDPSKPL